MVLFFVKVNLESCVLTIFCLQQLVAVDVIIFEMHIILDLFDQLLLMINKALPQEGMGAE